MSTPSPYLRDRLLQAADGLRKDAEQARLNVAAADQDVAAARALLQEAEAQAARARAEVDSISRGIAWLEREAAHLAPGPDPDPAEQLRATGLMRHEPKQADPQQRRELLRELTQEAVEAGSYGEPAQVADLRKPSDQPEPQQPCGNCGQFIYHNRLLGQWEHGATGEAGCNPDDPDTRLADPCRDDDLPFNVVQAPADVIAAITGGTRVITDEPLRIDTVHTSGTGAGQLVATSGPTVTMPDTGLNPDPLPPAPPTAEPRHAKPADRPGLLARLTGGHRIVHDAQDGDDRG